MRVEVTARQLAQPEESENPPTRSRSRAGGGQSFFEPLRVVTRKSIGARSRRRQWSFELPPRDRICRESHGAHGLIPQ